MSIRRAPLGTFVARARRQRAASAAWWSWMSSPSVPSASRVRTGSAYGTACTITGGSPSAPANGTASGSALTGPAMCRPCGSSRRDANPSRPALSWLPAIITTGTPSPRTICWSTWSRSSTARGGGTPRSYTSPATSTAAGRTSPTSSTKRSSRYSWSSVRWTPWNRRPRCQSAVWMNLIAARTIAQGRDTSGLARPVSGQPRAREGKGVQARGRGRRRSRGRPRRLRRRPSRAGAGRVVAGSRRASPVRPYGPFARFDADPRGILHARRSRAPRTGRRKGAAACWQPPPLLMPRPPFVRARTSSARGSCRRRRRRRRPRACRPPPSRRGRMATP